LANFNRYLQEALVNIVPTDPPLFVVVLDDLQRRISERPNFLSELQRMISDTTQFSSMLWVISVQDTLFDSVASAGMERFWQWFSATPTKAGIQLVRGRKSSFHDVRNEPLT